MSILNFLFCTIFLYGCKILCSVNAVEERKCFDCVSILSCQPAIEMARNISARSVQNMEKLRKAYCGLYKSTPKVCCSDFVVAETKSPEDMNVDAIENHQNIALLSRNCGQIESSRVLFHRQFYEFAWLALIYYHNNRADGPRLGCTGSVINSRYILTAAHCVVSRGILKDIAGVRIGQWDHKTKINCQEDYLQMNCESNVQDIRVETIIPHSDFSANPPMHDIALLRLTDSIDFSYRNARAICLPVYKHLRDMNLVNKTATFVGLADTRSESLFVIGANVPIWSSEACSYYKNNKRFGYENLTPITLCTGEYQNESRGIDSGGPLILEAEYDGVYRNVQYGIGSYGHLWPRSSETPIIYTDLTKYMGWILDNIKS